MKTNKCKICGITFTSKRKRANFCSARCRNTDFRRRNPEKCRESRRKYYKKNYKPNPKTYITNCKFCNTELKVEGIGVRPLLYCNHNCGQNYRNSLKNKPTTRKCKICKVEISRDRRVCDSCKKPKSNYKKTKYEKSCETCGKQFVAKRKDHKYCKRNCRPSKKESKDLRKRGVKGAKLEIESWSDIARFKDSRPEGCELDHIIPLNHPDVCGLHNTWNFQWLSREDNIEKGNKFDGTVENVSWKQHTEQNS